MSVAQISNPFTVCSVFSYTWSDWIVSIFTDLMLQINFVYSWCQGQFFKHTVTVLSEDVKYEINKLGQCWFPFLKTYRLLFFLTTCHSSDCLYIAVTFYRDMQKLQEKTTLTLHLCLPLLRLLDITTIFCAWYLKITLFWWHYYSFAGSPAS